jgi:hypothetical protein
LLRIEAQPGTGDWATARMRVALNGRLGLMVHAAELSRP